MSVGALPGEWDGLVVFVAGTAWDGQRGSDQHMAENLSTFAPVLYVDPPSSPRVVRRDAHLASERTDALRLVSARLARLTPRGLPGLERPGLHALNLRLRRRAIRGAVRAMNARVAATIVASLDNVFAAPSGVTVMYGTDDYVAGADLMGLSTRRLVREERAQLRRADIVIAVSEVLADRWRGLGANPVVIPNGVDCSAFADVDDTAWPEDVDLAPPIAGFVGFVSDRIDLRYLEAVAGRGCSLLIVGPAPRTFRTDEFQQLLQHPNVRWVGGKPFSILPSYLRTIDVGLTPYAITRFNQASFPLKTLEYLAAGRAAVATDLPAIRSLATDLVTIAESPDDFGAAVAEALRDPGGPDEREQRQAFARLHSWTIRATQLAEVIGLTSSGEPSDAR